MVKLHTIEKKKNNLMRFFGILKELDWTKKEDNMKKFRNSFKKRLQ